MIISHIAHEAQPTLSAQELAEAALEHYVATGDENALPDIFADITPYRPRTGQPYDQDADDSFGEYHGPLAKVIPLRPGMLDASTSGEDDYEELAYYSKETEPAAVTEEDQRDPNEASPAFKRAVGAFTVIAAGYILSNGGKNFSLHDAAYNFTHPREVGEVIKIAGKNLWHAITD